MATTSPNDQERTDEHRQILRDLPGFHLNEGDPCLCGTDYINTRTKRAFSDSLVFYHRCTDCGNEFSTWIEG